MLVIIVAVLGQHKDDKLHAIYNANKSKLWNNLKRASSSGLWTRKT